MADNAFIKIGTAFLKHQVKKLVGEETLGVISEELANIGGDKLDAWLGDNSTIEEIEKAAKTAEACFHDSIGDHELEQWMVSLPIGDLPKVLEAIEKLPTSPDEKGLEDAIRESVAGWRKLFPEQTDKAVNSFLSCLRSALLPIEKQTLMVIGRSVLRIEDKVDRLAKLVEQLKPYSSETSSQSRLGNEITVGRDVLNSVIVDGNNNVINYYAAVEKNIEKHEPDYWALKHPYPMPPNFTGRIAERATLTHWLKEDSENRLFILRALGGFGKSALTWQWLTHDVDITEYPKLVFWSFYEGDASFENFISETLQYLKLEVPQGQRPQVDELLKAMQSQKILLIMDGFERALRAYSSMNAAYQGDEAESPSPASGRGDRGEGSLDCVNINAEFFLKGVCSLPNIKSKVLITTRLTPRAVKPRGEFMLGCREEELTAMQKADAVEFFHKQKIKGTHAEIEAACAPYGYHPLSLRLLAGRILKDFDNPADIIVAQKLKIDGDIKQQKHHVLEVSYNSLPPHEQKLLSTIACFRSPVELKIIETIVENKKTLNEDLHDLIDRGLLNFNDKNKMFDLHPIVRRYTYECLPETDRTDMHIRLRDYFTTVNVPEHPQTLNDLAPIIELYHHTVKLRKYDLALDLFYERFGKVTHYQFGAYELEIELLSTLFTDNGSPLVSKIDDQAFALNQLANSYSMKGQPDKALSLFEKQISIRENQGANKNIAIGLGNLAGQQLVIGKLLASESNLRRSIDLLQKVQNKRWEAVTHEELGIVLTYRGMWDEAEKELVTAKEDLDLLGQNSFVSSVRVYQAVHIMLLMRSRNVYEMSQLYSAIEFARSALQLAADWAEFESPIESHFIASHRLLGAAFRIDGQLDRAEQHLTESLTRDRAINFVEYEADILLDLARLRYDQQKYEEAKSLAEEALTITERCGYVLQGADVNLFLAQYALEQEQDKAKAKEYAEEAKKLATCDGPPYYYKVAYEEAERMLEKL